MKNDWKLKKLGEVCEIVNGGTPSTKVSEYWGGNNLWITPKDMGKLNAIYVNDTERKITDDGLKNSSAKLLPKNSVVLSTRAPIGHLAINLSEISTNQGCKGIIPGKDVSTLFLFYFLMNSVQLLNDLGSGAIFKELSGSKLASIAIPVPPLQEQRRIATLIEEAIGTIDKAKENAVKNLENVKEILESHLQSVFTNSKDDWEKKTLNEVSENLDGKRVPITKSKRKNGIYPYYGASGVVDYVDDYIFDEELLLISEDGANLLARTKPVAFSVQGKIWVNNHAHILRFKNGITQKFVEIYIESIDLTEYITGAAQPKLNQRMLNSILIPYPSLPEQKNIVDKIEKLSTETKKLEEIYQQKIADLVELKKSILKKAFDGEL